MILDSTGIIAVAYVALRISGPGFSYLVFYQSWLYLVNLSFMVPDSGGIFVVAYPHYQSWLYLINLFFMTPDSPSSPGGLEVGKLGD